MQGVKVLRDGRRYTLREAFTSPSITKLDTIGWVQNHYTDFSVIYQFFNKNKPLNNFKMEPLSSMVENIYALEYEGNHFKIVKRLYSLAKLLDKKEAMDRLTTLLNSDLGRLYVITSDVGTLLELIRQRPTFPSHYRTVLASIRQRIETQPEGLKGVISPLSLAEQTKDPRVAVEALESLEKRLKEILNSNTPKLISIRNASRIISEASA
jgi:hypothetical protein